MKLGQNRKTTVLQDQSFYQALKTRDARFDGHFFAAVKTTGIYCRPVCRVRTPLEKNCIFFNSAAQAQAHGFRPCLRCRPELAPKLQPNWSIQDASQILAMQARQLIDQAVNHGQHQSLSLLAGQLGVSMRHFNRIFNQHLGVAPSKYRQAQRLLLAKQLLGDTRLPIHQIALLSGFNNARRLNAAFAEHYKLTPSACRQGALKTEPGARLSLAYRPDYHVPSLMQFFGLRAVAGLEHLSTSENRQTSYARIFQIQLNGKYHTGWIQIQFEEPANRVGLMISNNLLPILPAVLQQTRWALDLDADCKAIDAILAADFPQCNGWRVPGAWNGFETAVRAILGQQVSVAAARTLTHRLVKNFGMPVSTPWPELSHAFPTPQALLNASDDQLGQLGIVKQRQKAIHALADAVLHQGLQLSPGPDLQKTLQALNQLPGIGEWTSQYIAMRCLRWPDAFPAGDVAIQNKLNLRGLHQPATQAKLLSQKWQPWRSYAVIRIWHGDNFQ